MDRTIPARTCKFYCTYRVGISSWNRMMNICGYSGSETTSLHSSILHYEYENGLFDSPLPRFSSKIGLG